MVGLSDESKKALSELLETMDANDVVMMFIKHTGAQYEPEFFRLLLCYADVNIHDPIAFIESTQDVFWASDYDEVVAEMCGDYCDDIDESARKSFNDMVKSMRLRKDYDIHGQYNDIYQEPGGRKFVVDKKLNGDSFYPDYYETEEEFNEAIKLAQDRGYKLLYIDNYGDETHAHLSRRDD